MHTFPNTYRKKLLSELRRSYQKVLTSSLWSMLSELLSELRCYHQKMLHSELWSKLSLLICMQGGKPRTELTT
jgi:hypothetical protein